MYLTGGQFKGRKIEVPTGVKPTLSKVRESVFNMLQSYKFSKNTFLDMCAGSGIMGLEAVSRGYRVTQLEKNKKTALTIKNTCFSINITPNIIVTDCLKYKTDEKFDIVYLDPPWQDDYTNYVLKAYELIKSNSIIILEYDEKKPVEINKLIENNNLKLKIIKSKKYGRCLISLLLAN